MLNIIFTSYTFKSWRKIVNIIYSRQQHCHVEFLFKLFDKMLKKGDSLRIIKLYYKTLNSYLNAYLARPVITIKDRLGRLTGIIFLLSKSVKFITTSESKDKDIIVSSQHS